jgi:serine/threonine protein kinase/dipeptidyl aminopeptidase/acylaminoacyl peptidase
MTSSPEQDDRFMQLLAIARQKPSSERETYLRIACEGDEGLLSAIADELSSEERMGSFMQHPVGLIPDESTPRHTVANHVLFTAGLQVDQYRIESKLGEGGMSTVYLATDTRLRRQVAIKFLSDNLADAEARRRFQREAQIASSLNHPHIVTVHDVGEFAGRQYLVMECVNGGTLKDWAKEKKRTPKEIAALLTGVGDGLAAAHEAGMLHRDVKPTNILIARNGYAKLADFGLAKLAPAERIEVDPSSSQLPSQKGAILGTIAYMSPEQASGEALDSRSDIFSFAVVLYELMSGKRPFGGSTDLEVLKTIIHGDPPPLNEDTPAAYRIMVEKALEKNPAERYQSMREMVVDLKRAQRSGSAVLPPPLKTASVPVRTHRPWLEWGAVAVFLVALAALSLIHFRKRPSMPAPVQFQISPPGKLLQVGPFAVSPDGHHLAFAATGSDGIARLWIRDLDSLEVRILSDSHPATVKYSGIVPPFFWSHDSRFIGFQAGGKLAKIKISGGPAQVLCDVQEFVVGGSWNREDMIVFADSARGLMEVSAAGGVASPLTTFDASRKEVVHVLPFFLPDGRHFLYLRTSSSPENSGAYVGSANTKPKEQDSKRLLATTSAPVYVPSSDSDSGQVLFLRQGTLMAQPFDAHRLELSGEAVPIAEQVGSYLDYGFFSASNNGVLVYRSDAGQIYQPTWLDRQGKVLATVAEPGRYNSLALSPDGRRVAVSRTNPKNTPNWDVWLLDVGRNTSTRLTYEQVRAASPVWSADGSSVIFDSIRAGDVNLYRKLASGAGEERLLLKSNDGYKYATSSSRDGHFLLYTVENPKTKDDLWVLPLNGDHKPIPFLRTEFNESSGQFSPDGHWIAYTSDESGDDEIYVRRFSSSSAQGSWDSAGKWLISKGGGTGPRWRGDGKELFYVASDGKLMSVDISAKPVLEARTPRPLFQLPPGFIGGDVTPDGRRFLIGVPVAQSASVPFTVVLNWQTTLKK